MKKARRQYTREFKLEALQMQETSGKSATQIERELGIGKGNLYRWRRKLAQDGQEAFPGHGRLTSEQERIRQLEGENAILRQERDILKESRGLLLAPKKMRVQFVNEHRDEFPIRRICKALTFHLVAIMPGANGRPARERWPTKSCTTRSSVTNDNHGV